MPPAAFPAMLGAMVREAETLAEVLPTHTPELFQAAVERAVAELRAGRVVALPTETVYGLAANALDPAAVQRVFEIKGRPAHNPIIVHVASVAMAKQCVTEWPPIAERLARSFWPGPLTLVLPRSPSVPEIVTAGGPTVGVRWPSHPLTQAVIRACGFPLAAPSANPSNQLSPTCAEHVLKHLGKKVGLIVDGGHSNVGIESTVLDLSHSPPQVLRPGMIHDEALLAATGAAALGRADNSVILKSPGLLPKHYAPRAKLVVWSWAGDAELRERVVTMPVSLEQVFVVAHRRIPSGAGFGGVSVMPHDAPAFARGIYGELHRCDEAGAGLIVVEALPESAEWVGIADRLRRAAEMGVAQTRMEHKG